MITVTITENEQDQRLDRFLKKYFRNAPLSYLYKLIRTGVRVNGARAAGDTRLQTGDRVAIDVPVDEAETYLKRETERTALRQFRIAYEDAHTLVAEKPYGLLTHGTAEEKKNTLANQVIGYLIESGAYRAVRGATFSPSPVNRLDRNTTGLVVFGKDYEGLKAWNRMFRERDALRKFYLAIVFGQLREPVTLSDRMVKDAGSNRVGIVPGDTAEGKTMETVVRPLATAEGYTLVEVELLTGRSHQIRAHLASIGHPVIGDAKYGDPAKNRRVRDRFGLTTQFLHAERLEVVRGIPPLDGLSGRVFTAPLPENMERIRAALFGGAPAADKKKGAARPAADKKKGPARPAADKKKGPARPASDKKRGQK